MVTNRIARVDPHRAPVDNPDAIPVDGAPNTSRTIVCGYPSDFGWIRDRGHRVHGAGVAVHDAVRLPDREQSAGSFASV
jgi:hypothetical protein